MSNSHGPGRNEPCPCGSGRKFKFCCLGKTPLSPSAKRSTTRYVVMAVAGLGLVIVLGQTVFGPSPAERSENALKNAAPIPASWPAATTAPAGAGSAALAPQPPGPAPAGKVWSPEHGHWHDTSTQTSAERPESALPNAASAAMTGAGSVALTPQPPGPAPAGKVWSPEHGHWHDAPAEPASPSP